MLGRGDTCGRAKGADGGARSRGAVTDSGAAGEEMESEEAVVPGSKPKASISRLISSAAAALRVLTSTSDSKFGGGTRREDEIDSEKATEAI